MCWLRQHPSKSSKDGKNTPLDHLTELRQVKGEWVVFGPWLLCLFISSKVLMMLWWTHCRKPLEGDPADNARREGTRNSEMGAGGRLEDEAVIGNMSSSVTRMQ